MAQDSRLGPLTALLAALTLIGAFLVPEVRTFLGLRGSDTTVASPPRAPQTSDSNRVDPSTTATHLPPSSAVTPIRPSSVPAPTPQPTPSSLPPTPAATPTLRLDPGDATIRSAGSLSAVRFPSDWIQFHALYDPDGPAGPSPEKDVTFSCRWKSSSSVAVHMNEHGYWDRGIFGGVATGSTVISAYYSQGLHATATLHVVR